MRPLATTHRAYFTEGTFNGVDYEAEFTFCPITNSGDWYFDDYGDLYGFQDGTLEFEGIEVVDYDGAFDLPIPLQKLIESRGFKIA